MSKKITFPYHSQYPSVADLRRKAKSRIPKFAFDYLEGGCNEGLNLARNESDFDNIYLKPTAVLVSGDTVSAAEVFTIAISSLPQVTIIGEPTAGALSDVLVKRLTSDILFGISNETYTDTQGKNYEGIGISPDIAVPFATIQERQGGYDGGLDRAIDWIKSAH